MNYNCAINIMGNKLIFLILLFVIEKCVSDFTIKSIDDNFNSLPTTVKTFENDTVLLPCYHNSPFRSLKWRRVDEVIVDTTISNIELPDKYNYWINGSLQVNQVTMDDTGEYYCEILTAGGLAKQLHAIEVQYAPSVLSIPSGRIELNVGTIFEMICDAKGVPDPIVTWRVKGETVTELYKDQRRYVVEVKNRSIAGPIECVASNGVGLPAVAGIQLIVLFSPEVQATANTVHTKIGLRAHLECYSTAVPVARVHWFKKGVPLIVTSNNFVRYDVETNENGTNPFTDEITMKHTLVIKKVHVNDLGMYECRGENTIGYSGAHIEVTGRPIAPVFKSSSEATDNSSFNLIWQTESVSGISDYVFRFRQMPARSSNDIQVEWKNLTIPSDGNEGPIHTTSYSLKGLLPATSYEVIVKARNRYGFSHYSKILRFTTSGEIELQHYTTETLDYEHEEESDEAFITDKNYLINYETQHSRGNIIYFNYIFLLLLILLCFALKYQFL